MNAENMQARPLDGRTNEKMFKIFFVAAYILYAACFIYNTSSVVDNQRYFLLADDAVISMQFAKNFAAGHGLCWSLDTRVEGITNPLWTFYMTIPHFLKIPLSKTGLFIQLTALILMLMTLKLVWEMSKSKTALVFTAFFYRMNFWYYSGLEVSLLTLMTVYVVYLVLNNEDPLKIYLICGIMTLVRIDMALFFAGTIIIYRKSWIKGLIILAAFMAFQTAARYIYYGDILPNTYYLKMAGYKLQHRLFRGTITFFNNLYYMNWIPFIAVLPFIKTKEQKTMLMFIVIPVLYSFYIGGDIGEMQGGTNRFETAVVPLYFILFANGFYKMMELLKVENKIVVFLVLFALFLNFNSLTGPKSLKNMIAKVIDTKQSTDILKIALYLRDNFNDNTVIATQRAGILPYFSEKKYYIDLHGKSDRYIAKRPVSHINSWWDILTKVPGHIKYDLKYSIIEKKPDIVVHNMPDETVDRYLLENYTESRQPGFAYVWYKKSLMTVNKTLPE